MGWITVYSILSTIEAWVTGYKSEHLRLGLQQGIAQALALLPVLIDRVFKAVDKGGSALFIAVTVRATGQGQGARARAAAPPPFWPLLPQVAVVLEPSTGDAFRKLALRLLGAGLSGGIGILLMFFGEPHLLPSPATGACRALHRQCIDGSRCTAAVGHNSYDYQSYQRELAAWMVPGLALLSCAYTVNQQRYGAYREFWSLSLFTLPIVVVPSIRCGREGRQGRPTGRYVLPSHLKEGLPRRQRPPEQLAARPSTCTQFSLPAAAPHPAPSTRAPATA